MRFTVVWSPEAMVELAELWLSAANRGAIQKATDEIDRRLKIDAHEHGQPFFEDRVLIVPPLAVAFSVSMADCLVTVWQVWSREPA